MNFDTHEVAVGALLNTLFEMGLGRFSSLNRKDYGPRFLLAFGVPEIVACIPLSLEIRGAHYRSGGTVAKRTVSLPLSLGA